MPKKILAITSFFLFFLLSATSHALEGTAISSTPYTINTPGMYHLTGNLTQTSSFDNIIVISTDNVTLDLNGFTIQGMGSRRGIQIIGSNIEIRNGTITGTSYAIDAPNGSSNIKVHNIRATNNAKGINLWGNKNLVADCVVSSNGSGITAHYSTVKNNLASDNTYHGISAGHSVVINNTVSNNGNIGIMSDNSTVIGNTVSKNATGGILGSRSTIQSNTLSDNGNYSIRGNTAHIANNTITDVTSSTTIGILGNATTIRDNHISDLPGIGIQAGNKTHVFNNNIYNTDIGIEANGTKNIIESNSVDGSRSQGIYFSSSDNFYKDNKVLGGFSPFSGNVPSGIRDGGGNISF